MSAAVSIYIYDHTPSGQSRLYRVTQLRTDGVHCRESVVSKHNHCCTAAVHTVDPFPPPIYVCTSVESLVYMVQYHMLCFKTYRGTMYYCCTLWTGFYPPDLCLSTCKELIVRYNNIRCVSKHSYYYCTVDSFFPSRLLSVRETPCMSAAWKTILKQVCYQWKKSVCCIY